MLPADTNVYRPRRPKCGATPSLVAITCIVAGSGSPDAETSAGDIMIEWKLPWRRMTSHDASLIKGMIARGDSRDAIAKTMRISRGRMAGVLSGDKFPDSPVYSLSDLPPAKS